MAQPIATYAKHFGIIESYFSAESDIEKSDETSALSIVEEFDTESALSALEEFGKALQLFKKNFQEMEQSLNRADRLLGEISYSTVMASDEQASKVKTIASKELGIGPLLKSMKEMDEHLTNAERIVDELAHASHIVYE
jgi:hypothetical protein